MTWWLISLRWCHAFFFLLSTPSKSCLGIWLKLIDPIYTIRLICVRYVIEAWPISWLVLFPVYNFTVWLSFSTSFNLEQTYIMRYYHVGQWLTYCDQVFPFSHFFSNVAHYFHRLLWLSKYAKQKLISVSFSSHEKREREREIEAQRTREEGGENESNFLWNNKIKQLEFNQRIRVQKTAASRGIYPRQQTRSV